MEVLFKTRHGSHLYNLNHADSDEDFYVVVDKVKTSRAKFAKQTILDNEDTVVLDLGTWLGQCQDGVPQALEAMMSQGPLVDRISDLRAGYLIAPSAGERYLRTITSFCMTQDTKRKRHGLRLALNMYSFSRSGRFNPRLSERYVSWVTEQARKDCDAVYAKAMSIALDRLPTELLG